MAEKQEEKKVSKIIVAVVFLFVVFLGYAAYRANEYRLLPVRDMARDASSSVAKEMEQDTEELGFAAAQAKIQKLSEQKIAELKGEQQLLAVVGGFLALEARFAKGYENYCKDHGLSSMPGLKKYAIERNKAVHDKAVALMNKAGISLDLVENQMIEPMMPQLEQVIGIEIKSLGDETGETPETICRHLEESAAQNEDLEIKNQRPDIVKIIEDAYSAM